jgi:hypothetical protein
MSRANGRSFSQRFFARSDAFLRSDFLHWALVGLGALLRFRQYLFNRSLWHDETLLSLNVIERSFSGLLERLSSNQHAPIGFLFLQRLSVLLFGSGEYALRLVPLLAGIASLFLFLAVARRTLPPEARPVALALFALCGPLVYYSSEAKQYSSDVAVALLILVATLEARKQSLTLARATTFAVLGAAAVWLSHPAALVLAGSGLVLGLPALRSRDRQRLATLLVIGAAWAASFAVSYFLVLRQSLADPGILNWWKGDFVPSPLLSFAAGKWLALRFVTFFRSPVGLPFDGIGILAFIIGCAALRGAPGVLWIVLSPVVAAVVASALRVYPLGARLDLFLVPSVILVIARGADWISEKTRQELPLLGPLFLALLVLPSAGLAAHILVKPETRDEVRPILAYVREHWKEGDLIYGYRSSAAFRYYLPRFGFDDQEYHGGVDVSADWRADERDLEGLRGRERVWIVFPRPPKQDPNIDFYLHTLDAMGTRLDSYERPGAASFLYRLSRAGKPPPAER